VSTLLAAEFDFDLPHELIAQHPAEPRDSARLMVVDRLRGVWSHHSFAELPQFFEYPDTLVRNNTRVVPARLVGRRVLTGGKWEGLFLQEADGGIWEMLVKSRNRLAAGELVTVGQDLHLIIEGYRDCGTCVVRPLNEGSFMPVGDLLERYGQVPLPPYIRHGREEPGDRESYQTIYAVHRGSVAAPTAGLHFTERLFNELTARRINFVDLTLHVGWGTFRSMEAEHLDDHVVHPEFVELSSQAAATLETRRRDGGRIVAVGSTSARALETAATSGGIVPIVGQTHLFIRPGHIFCGVDALITNFHLPRSSLLVLVSALAGVDLIRAAYMDAIRQHYRFYSYGDAMLIR
jgi:S-adenosylmethionine:tRNA ribosyltransferase-isomerase